MQPAAGVRRHHSSALPLAWLAVAVVVYASLYPFSGWRWPGDLSVWELFELPLPPWRYKFDIWANYLGYIPIAGLTHAACVRGGGRSGRCWLFTVVSISLLSFAMELVQQFLPQRFPSRLDWALNTAGAVAGASLSALALWLGWLDRWQQARDRWFIRRSGGALALLAAWPLGLLFPTPMPLGLGPSWARLQDGLMEALVDVRGAEDLVAWLADSPAPAGQLSALPEALGMALGLLAPCLLAFVVTRPGWRRIVMALGAAVLGLATTTLSAALNFGPAHALAWMTPVVLPAGALALLVCAVLTRAPAALAAVLGVAAVSAGMMLVAQAPSDPYFALSLQGWEQGRFIHFHGLAQWVGWLWPVAALLWLAIHLGSRPSRDD
ncbi:teicoplanin resistance protein VanZ [Ideonella sp. DXS29W]|uniref:Teicoplanin resistance protein VanZ n=1 Tax=Ideonella lacteola TaxID=2984193 RepID=A0ABU9BQD8_9BURK